MSDFKKLLRFADIIGIPVEKRSLPKSDAGHFVYEGAKSRVELNKGAKQCLETTLILLHEIGHALDWIQLGRPDIMAKSLVLGSDLNRKQRYEVWCFEKRAVMNMALISSMLQLKVPYVRLRTEQEYDLWVANHYYLTNSYPPLAKRKKQWDTIHKRIKRENKFRKGQGKKTPTASR